MLFENELSNLFLKGFSQPNRASENQLSLFDEEVKMIESSILMVELYAFLGRLFWEWLRK
ncbi:MAG: hypothetical protein AAF490_29370 [Chloroflexota bacterium]